MPAVLRPYARHLKLLCLSRYYPHKNLECFVELFERHGDRLKDVVIFLTIGEKQHPKARKLLQELKRRKLESRIVNLGPVASSQLEAYYRHVDALVLPTLLESFSATYVEAMQFRCPILTSDMDFSRAVCGDAAMYFNPRDVRSLYHTILRFGSSGDIRDCLRRRGERRLPQIGISWEHTSRTMLAKLEEMCRN
jgi:glycosyltransferase involved in cell wall biosynthesis